MDIDKIISEITSQVIGQAQGASKSAGTGAKYDASYGQYMDHTVLKPATTQSTVAKFCELFDDFVALHTHAFDIACAD